MANSDLPIVIDVGSGETKAGYNNAEAPSLQFPSYIGEIKYKKLLRPLNINLNNEPKEQYIGSDCNNYLGILNLHYPLKNGIFENEDDIYNIYEYIFHNLNLKNSNIKNHSLLITEPILNPKSNREKIANILFENFDIQSLIFAHQPILSLFHSACLSGIILESGDNISQVCCAIDGNPILGSFSRSNLGGRDITEYLRILLKKHGVDYNSQTEFLYIQQLKQTHCYLNNTLFNKMNNDFYGKKIRGETKKEETITKVTLPDRKEIKLQDEKILAPSVLFFPSLIGKNCMGIHQLVANSINKVDLENREKILESGRITGGNAQIKNCTESLHTGSKALLPGNNKLKFVQSPRPNLSCWIGGQIISNLSLFNKLVITKKEWEEKGNEILHKKTI